ncbi:EamA family transporter, partial [Klebsiella pneumoniae]
MDAKQTRLGIILALAAYFIWGIAPAYFKLIYYVPADEILTHRVIWSFFFMVALISPPWRRNGRSGIWCLPEW